MVNVKGSCVYYQARWGLFICSASARSASVCFAPTAHAHINYSLKLLKILFNNGHPLSALTASPFSWSLLSK